MDKLYIPKNERRFDQDILLSIVIPALNENLTIETFVDWCHEGIAKANIAAEILIIDSSSDDTMELALSKGARVLKTPKRGLGQAYIDAIPYIRGKYILMGDCDLTYEFRDIDNFVNAFKNGYEFIMGSRIKGKIEKNAMPKLHRYFGTPLTTFLLNKIYKTKFTDIHCGIRGITKDALIKVSLDSAGWEYASEMIVKAARLSLRTVEIPVNFYKDIPGRESHLKRSGFLMPWVAGWMNLKVMLIYSADSFINKPSIVCFVLGLLMFVLSVNNCHIGNFNFNLHSFVLSLFLILLSSYLSVLAIFIRFINNLRDGYEKILIKIYKYEIGISISFLLFTLGLLTLSNFLQILINNNFILSKHSNSFFYSCFFIFLSVSNLALTLILELIRRRNKDL